MENSTAQTEPSSDSHAIRDDSEVDSICGLLMQLRSEMDERISTRGIVEPKSNNLLQITKEDKSKLTPGTLAWLIFSENGIKEKDSTIKSLLETEPADRLNSTDARGRTVLMYAMSEAPPTSPIESILKCDRIDLLARDRAGNTALMYATSRGYDSSVRLFMSEFKRRFRKDYATMLDFLDAENDEGESAITLALRNGHEDCACALSEYLKEALSKEERRVTSFTYRLGLRRRKESQFENPLANKKEDDGGNVDSDLRVIETSTRSPPIAEEEEEDDRMRSSSPKKTRSERLRQSVAHLREMGGRRAGRGIARYYADEEDGLLDSDCARFDPESSEGTPGL